MREVTSQSPVYWRRGIDREIVLIPNLPAFKWRVFIPIFLLYFNYVFGVAAGVLGEFKLVLRLFVLLVIVFGVVVSNLKASVGALVVYLSLFLYFLLLFLGNQNPVTLNFIYVTIFVGFLYLLGVSQDELLFNALVASLLVVFIYIVYFFSGSIDLGESNIEGRIRYSFGFNNPNKVGIVTFSLIALTALYAFKRNYSFVAVVFLIVPFFVVMVYSGSRTALYSTGIFFFLILAPFAVRLRRILYLLPLMFLMLSIFLATLHTNETINNLLSFRPVDFYNFLSTVDSADYLFGTDSSEFRIDNSYILALFAVGPIGFIVISYLLYRTGRGRLNVYGVSFVISVLIYGLFEGVLVRVEFPLILYFYYLIAARDSRFCDGVLGYFDGSESSRMDNL